MLRFTFFALFAALVATGCSDDSDGGAPADAGASSDAATAADTSPAEDAGAETGTSQPLNGCTSYTDQSDGGVTTIAWGFAATPPATCVRVKKGESVTFEIDPPSDDFATHPIAAKGGTSPSPFDVGHVSGKSATFTFPDTGTYGFHCIAHPVLTGAVEVVD